QVVPLRVAVVHAYQDRVRVPGAHADHRGRRLLEGRQVARLAAVEVERIEVVVLVAAGVAHVQQGAGLVGPEVAADAAALVTGYGAGAVEVVGRRDPDVEHAVDRGDPAQVRAVGADLYVGALGVAEQRLARDQVDFLD